MKRLATGTAFLTLAAPGVFGHHAVVPNFDLSQDIVLVDAVVTEFKFVNPHVYILLEVPDGDGAIAEWRCEMASASRLRDRGWTAETLVPGQTMSIDGSPARRESNVCHISMITLEDGSTIAAGYDGRPLASEVSGGLVSAEAVRLRPRYLPNGQPNLRGPWVATQDSLAMPEIEPTAGGAEAAAGLVRHFDSPALRCHPGNIVFAWIFERETNDIYQEDDRITLQYGYVDLVRTIHLDQAEHPADIMPSVTGHSIGRWEGDTLVVDTIGFEPGVLDHMARSGFAMHSERWHVMERFKVGEDGRSLTRTYTFDDPFFMQGSYTGTDFASLTTGSYVPYDCEELSGQNNQRPVD